MPDLLEFFQDHVSIAMIEALYETTLTSQHLNFVRDLWVFDEVMPKLAKRLLKLIILKTYKLREKLLRDVKSWQAVAREKFDDSKVYKDGDADPFWGSELLRSRQKLLLSRKMNKTFRRTGKQTQRVVCYNVHMNIVTTKRLRN